MSLLSPYMGAPQSGLLGNAESYGFPMTSGLLGALNAPHDYTQDALALAGNPHAGPYANVQPLPAGGGMGNAGNVGSTGSSFGSMAMGLLGTLAKNPSLVKNGVSAIERLLGGSSLSPFGSAAASGTASELGSAAAPALAADTSAALAPAVGAAPTAAELGTTADAMAPIATSSAPAASTASTGAMGAGAGAATAVGLAALPLLLASVVPYNAGFSGSEVQGMLNDIQAATKANGGLLNAGSGISNGQISNPQLANAFQDLTTLIGTNPAEFTKSGGTGPIDQQLTAMGYGGLLHPWSPITSPLAHGWMGNNVFGRSSGRQVRA